MARRIRNVSAIKQSLGRGGDRPTPIPPSVFDGPKGHRDSSYKARSFRALDQSQKSEVRGNAPTDDAVW
jgi:hypothetical protein